MATFAARVNIVVLEHDVLPDEVTDPPTVTPPGRRALLVAVRRLEGYGGSYVYERARTRRRKGLLVRRYSFVRQ